MLTPTGVVLLPESRALPADVTAGALTQEFNPKPEREKPRSRRALPAGHNAFYLSETHPSTFSAEGRACIVSMSCLFLLFFACSLLPHPLELYNWLAKSAPEAGRIFHYTAR